jgi:hypothetical protein
LLASPDFIHEERRIDPDGTTKPNDACLQLAVPDRATNPSGTDGEATRGLGH